MTRVVLFASVALLALPAAARAGVNPQVAGLQVALRAHGLYLAQIDGIAGPRTAKAVHAFQRQHGLPVGVADARTRAALGPLGRPLFGSRTIRRGDFGFDVSVLQFLLTRSGVYSGALDGYMGKQTSAALQRYQRRMHLSADAIVGPSTLAVIVRRDKVPVRAKPAPAVVVVIHVVKPGDTLTAIAAQAGTTVNTVASLNKIDPAQPIIIGQKLKLPATASSATPTAAAVRARLDAWSAKLGVDPHLVRALAWMESGFQTRIVSSAGARGVLQTLPSTRSYVETVLVGHAVPRTVDGDIEVGVLYLRHLLQAFHGNDRLALAAWYEGERAVREHGVYKVSKPFVDDVLALRTRM